MTARHPNSLHASFFGSLSHKGLLRISPHLQVTTITGLFLRLERSSMRQVVVPKVLGTKHFLQNRDFVSVLNLTTDFLATDAIAKP